MYSRWGGPYMNLGPVFSIGPSLRSSVQVLTMGVVKRNIAIKGVFDTSQGHLFPFCGRPFPHGLVLFSAHLGGLFLEFLIFSSLFFIFTSPNPALKSPKPALKRAKEALRRPNRHLKKKKNQNDQNRHLSAETGT